MNEMLKKLQEVEPLADLKSLSRKIHAYRTTFRTAHKKYISCKSGASSDDVKEPTLWYYNILFPTAVTHGSARRSKNTLEVSFFDYVHDDFKESSPLMSSSCVNKTQPIEDHDNTFFEPRDMDEFAGNNTKFGNIFETAVDVKNAENSNFPSKQTKKTNQKHRFKNNSLIKPKKKKNVEDLLEVACEVLTRPESSVIPNRFSAVATNVSAILEELNKSNPIQCILAEKLVNDILFQARLGQLTLKTCIAELTEND